MKFAAFTAVEFLIVNRCRPAGCAVGFRGLGHCAIPMDGTEESLIRPGAVRSVFGLNRAYFAPPALTEGRNWRRSQSACSNLIAKPWRRRGKFPIFWPTIQNWRQPFMVHYALETSIFWLITWHCLSDVRKAISDASRPLPIRTMPSIGARRVGSMSHQPFSR